MDASAGLTSLLATVRMALGPADEVLDVSADPRIDGVPDESYDVVVGRALWRRLPGAKAHLELVLEIGRVLRPGGWAVIELSTDPSSQPAPAPAGGSSRRDLFRSLGGRAAPPSRPPGAAFVPLDALGAVAVQAGLTLERIEGAGTPETVVLMRR